MNNNSEHTDLLIVRYLSGEATPKERNQLENWLENSDANKKYFAQIRFINNKAKASQKIIRVSVDAAWKKVRKEMHSTNFEAKKSKSYRPGYRIIHLQVSGWLKVAAILIIIISFSWIIFNQFPLHTEPMLVSISSSDTIVSKQLNDNSEIVLNRNTKIEYSDDFGKTERHIHLEGEAFFRVESIPQLPFVVKTKETYIKQLSTSFNIRAYESDSIVEVFTKSGKLHFYTHENEGLVLNEGETGIYNRNTGEFFKTIPDITNILSYVTREFIFHFTPLNKVFEELNSVYNVDIRTEHDEIKNLTITVTFSNEELNLILDIICETLDLQWYEKSDRVIIIKKINDYPL